MHFHFKHNMGRKTCCTTRPLFRGIQALCCKSAYTFMHQCSSWQSESVCFVYGDPYARSVSVCSALHSLLESGFDAESETGECVPESGDFLLHSSGSLPETGELLPGLGGGGGHLLSDYPQKTSHLPFIPHSSLNSVTSNLVPNPMGSEIHMVCAPARQGRGGGRLQSGE